MAFAVCHITGWLLKSVWKLKQNDTQHQRQKVNLKSMNSVDSTNSSAGLKEGNPGSILIYIHKMSLRNVHSDLGRFISHTCEISASPSVSRSVQSSTKSVQIHCRYLLLVQQSRISETEPGLSCRLVSWHRRLEIGYAFRLKFINKCYSRQLPNWQISLTTQILRVKNKDNHC